MVAPVNLEPTAAVTLLLTAAFGPVLAGIIGPYSVIIICALVGGGWSLSRREPTDRGSATIFLLLITSSATFLTVGASYILNHLWLSLESATWLLAPVSMLIGIIGHDWPRVGKWLVGPISRWIEDKFGPGSRSGDQS